MTSSDSREDRILERLVTGALDESSAEAQAAFEQAPELREAWSKFSALRQEIESASLEERAVRQEAEATSSSLSVDEIEALVLANTTTRQRSRATGWLLAAGLIIGLGLGAILFSGDDAGPARPSSDLAEIVLSDNGDSPMDLLSPYRNDQGTLCVAWTDSEESLGRSYFIEVYTVENGAAGELVTESGLLPGPLWEVPDGESNKIPEWAYLILRAEDLGPAPPHTSIIFKKP